MFVKYINKPGVQYLRSYMYIIIVITYRLNDNIYTDNDKLSGIFDYQWKINKYYTYFVVC